ncbi:hypothetical protein ACWDE0_43525 [Streptomyces sp. 900105755]
MNVQFKGSSAHSMLGNLDDVQFARRDCRHRARLAAMDDPASALTAQVRRVVQAAP